MRSAEETSPGELRRDVPRAFQVEGDLVDSRRLRGGHIHETWAATYRGPGGTVRLVHQRINTEVFEDVAALAENVVRVSRHLRERLLGEGVEDPERRALTVVPAADGRPCWTGDDGEVWRTFLLVPQAATRSGAIGRREARAAARAFGDFQRRLLDLPRPRLRETISAFHDTPARLRRLREAIASDPLGRLEDARDEVAAVEARAGRTGALLEARDRGELPERTVHNDTKLDNVLFDETSREAICVIDLDTTMPGLAPWDFGDMVRSAVAGAPEDRADPGAVRLREEIYEALARGYLKAAGPFLEPAEIEALAPAAELITLEAAIRFLTDHLRGDRYFRIERPGQNLERCRSQLLLLEELEGRREFCEETVAGIAGEVT